MPARWMRFLAVLGTMVMQTAAAQSYSFTLLHKPYSSIAAINDKGGMAVNIGNAQNEENTCFLDQGVTRTKIVDQDAEQETFCTGLSNAGLLAGYTRDVDNFTNFGFFYSKGVYDDSQYPVLGAEPLAVSLGRKNVAGTFYPDQPVGYVIRGTKSMIFQAPNALLTEATSINDRGVATVFSLDQNYAPHSYILKGRAFTEYQFPGANETVADGINNAGVVTGFYYTANAVVHGFTYDPASGVSATVDVPDTSDTRWYGINSGGTLAGVCIPASGKGSGLSYGVLAQPQ